MLSAATPLISESSRSVSARRSRSSANRSIPAALVAGAASNMLRAVAQALGSSSSPGEVLAQVNETLLARIPANMFFTCFFAIVEDESGRLLYANAGHNLPCCRRDDEHAAATTTTDLSARGMSLGIMPQMNYEEREHPSARRGRALLHRRAGR